MVLTNGQALVVQDLEQGAAKDSLKWPGDVGAISFQNDGGKLNVTLDIAPHDYRLLRIEGASR